MGFDNECILNIQSLAGEYFCPVCRLLVFPNEALQSQCTHLYCKPCLTYVVSTTRACPYDGYLVTEADSKPLVESNKTLAETIGNIPVHCLFHRSGCTWQGTLSDCTSHCAGCAFGNSPVVCNRCGIQIVHRQVQEHAQTCPGQVQQAAGTQDPSATSAAAIASTDQNQVAAPVAATASQPLTSQTAVATTTPGLVSNQLPNPASQTQAVAQTSLQSTAEQWYQHQQQYQQYYQQYPGQDPYQQQYQQYYPYQQSAVPQYQQAYGQPQPQVQAQPQPQPQPQVQHQLQPQSQPQPQAQGPSQSLPHVQAPVASQSQNQMQVHQQPQQPQPAVQPHGQMSHPPGHGQAFPQTQAYPYPQVQPHSGQPQPHMQVPPYQQPHPQMQHSQPQAQLSSQKYPAPQVHPQMQPNASIQHLSQPQMHPHQPMTTNVQPQVQNASSNAVTGHHSYPQPLPHQNMQPGAPQHTMHTHPQSGPQLQAQHSVQTQNQFPHQTPMMRPNQSHNVFPNQQQAAFLPSSVPSQSTPPLQQQQMYTHNQQTGQTNQRPILQPAQQKLSQQPSAQHQMLVPSHLRPQGPANSFPKHAYPQPHSNTALSQNAVGRPSIPNHAGHVQPFAQSVNTIPVRPGNQNLLGGTNNQVQLSTELQSRVPESVVKGDVNEQQTDSASGKLNELKSEKETDLKSSEAGSKLGEDPHSVKTSGTNANALDNGDSASKNSADSNGHSAVQGTEIQDGPPLTTETKISESETHKLHSDDTCTPRPPPGADNAVPAVSHTNGGLGPGALAQPSHPGSFTDQQTMNNYKAAAFQQNSSAMLASQLPHQTHSAENSLNLIRNHGPAPALHSGQPLNSGDNFQRTMFKPPHGSDIQFNNPGQSFQPQPLGPPGPYNQAHEPLFHSGASNLSRIGGPQFGAPPPGDMHSRMVGNLPVHAHEGFGVQDERFKSFSQQNFDQREFEDDLKRFPRPPMDAEPVSKFGKFSLDPHEAGKRPFDFYDDAIKKPGYLGPGPGYGRHRMDAMAPRSPASDYAEMPSRRLGPHSSRLVGNSGIDDFDGRAENRFDDSVGIAFRDGRFPRLPSNLHRDEFDGFGNFRVGEHPGSGDFIGRDEFAGHFQRGERLGPHNFPRHLQLGERNSFGVHPGHMRDIEFGPRGFESFSKGNRPGHPQLGEPGFRSSFSRQGFPNDAGFLPGDIRSFDNLRRRKVASMGWCRICKVDCETVEGLELHSQTREHQKMAMDIVKTIKQNVKKQKLVHSEQSSVEDGNKTRNSGFEAHGNNH